MPQPAIVHAAPTGVNLSPFKEKLMLLALAAIQFTSMVDFMIMMPLGPQLMREFGINTREFGMAVSAYTFSAGISGFAAAFFIDRFDRKQALLFLFTGFTIGTFACGMAPTFITLLAARLFTGLFGGILGALIFSVVGDAIPFERRGAAMGIVMTAFSAASVLGLPLGLTIAGMYNWHAPFIFLSGFAVVVWVLIFFVVPSMRGHISKAADKESPWEVLKMIAKNSNQKRALGSTTLMMLAQFLTVPFSSAFLVSNVKFPEHMLKYNFMLGGALTIVTGPLIGKLADRIGKPVVFTIFSLALIIPMYIMCNLGPSSVIFVLLFNALVMVIATGRGIPLMTMVTGTVSPAHRGGFMSINTCMQNLSCALAAFLGGLLIYQGPNGQLVNYNTAGVIAIFITVGGMLLGRTLKPVAQG